MMNRVIGFSIMMVVLAVGSVGFAGQSARELANKGHATFLQVLGGDESKYSEAIRYMEQARETDPTDTVNLYNLARAYFFQAATNGSNEYAVKAEQVLAKLLELKPNDTRALSFHGSVLTSISQGRDIAKFMQGAQEMKGALAKDPNDINNRIVIAFTARNFPPQALAAMGNYDSLKDLEFVRDAFNGQWFDYAPHADVVMHAFVGEAYKARGDEANARKNYQAALDAQQPTDGGEKKGRAVLDQMIRTRLNGGDKPLGGQVFGGCHSCHLNAPEKLPTK